MSTKHPQTNSRRRLQQSTTALALILGLSFFCGLPAQAQTKDPGLNACLMALSKTNPKNTLNTHVGATTFTSLQIHRGLVKNMPDLGHGNTYIADPETPHTNEIMKRYMDNPTVAKIALDMKEKSWANLDFSRQPSNRPFDDDVIKKLTGNPAALGLKTVEEQIAVLKHTAAGSGGVERLLDIRQQDDYLRDRMNQITSIPSGAFGYESLNDYRNFVYRQAQAEQDGWRQECPSGTARTIFFDQTVKCLTEGARQEILKEDSKLITGVEEHIRDATGQFVRPTLVTTTTPKTTSTKALNSETTNGTATTPSTKEAATTAAYDTAIYAAKVDEDPYLQARYEENLKRAKETFFNDLPKHMRNNVFLDKAKDGLGRPQINIYSEADLALIPDHVWKDAGIRDVESYKNAIRAALNGNTGLIMSDKDNYRFFAVGQESPMSKAITAEIATTPTTTPHSPWDYLVRNQPQGTVLQKAMIAAGENMTLADRNAALEKLNALHKELYGPDADIYKAINPYSGGYLENMFITGAINNPAYYDQLRAQKKLVDATFQKELGRAPTQDELYRNMMTTANIAGNERVFETNIRPRLEQGVLLGTNGAAATRYTDAQVIDGIHAEYKSNPNMDIATIREKARAQYGITDEQLNRVIPDLWTDDEGEDWVRGRIDAGLNEAQIREEAKRVYGGTDSQLDRIKERIVGPTPTPAARQYSNAQVADGVHEYIRNNPNANEAEIRRVATEQYGVQKDQLDEVKAQYFPEPAPVVAAPVAAPATPAAPSRQYSNAQVADGVHEYIRNNPNATEAEIRRVATEQYGVQKDQLDEVKAQYFQ